METKVPPPPKFDLAASNFPPLPGSVVSMLGETMPEMRLSDVVRGLKVTNKVNIVHTFFTVETAVSHKEGRCLNVHHCIFLIISACESRGCRDPTN